MAIFPDADGYWVNTSEDAKKEKGTSFYESLVPTMNPSENPYSGWNRTQPLTSADIARIEAGQAEQKGRIDEYTNQFRASVDTNGAAGENALKALLSDGSQDKEVRAAASNALYPGMDTTIGRNGELSFTAKNTTLGFDYPNQVLKSNPELAAKTEPAKDNFDAMFTAIENMTDANDIMNAYAQLKTASTEFLNSKRAGYENVIGRGLGYDQYDNKLATSKLLDQEYYDQYHNGVSQGATDETKALEDEMKMTRIERDRQVQNKLSADSELVFMNSRLEIMGALVQSRIGNTIDPGTTSLVSEKDVESVIIANGQNPAEVTDAVKLAVRKDLDNNDPNSVNILNIAGAPVSQLLTIAATANAKLKSQAMNLLGPKIQTPGIANQIIAEFKQFDSKYLPKLSDAEKEQYTLGVLDTGGSEAERTQAQVELDNRKMNFIINKYAIDRKESFTQNLGQWAPPQSELIGDDWAAVQTVLKDTGIDRPPTLQDLIGNMNLSGPNATPKINALAEYIVSQAKNTTDTSIFGNLPVYSDFESTRSMINGIIQGRRAKLVNPSLSYQLNPYPSK